MGEAILGVILTVVVIIISWGVSLMVLAMFMERRPKRRPCRSEDHYSSRMIVEVLNDAGIYVVNEDFSCDCTRDYYDDGYGY